MCLEVSRVSRCFKGFSMFSFVALSCFFLSGLSAFHA